MLAPPTCGVQPAQPLLVVPQHALKQRRHQRHQLRVKRQQQLRARGGGWAWVGGLARGWWVATWVGRWARARGWAGGRTKLEHACGARARVHACTTWCGCCLEASAAGRLGPIRVSTTEHARAPWPIVPPVHLAQPRQAPLRGQRNVRPGQGRHHGHAPLLIRLCGRQQPRQRVQQLQGRVRRLPGAQGGRPSGQKPPAHEHGTPEGVRCSALCSTQPAVYALTRPRPLLHAHTVMPHDSCDMSAHAHTPARARAPQLPDAHERRGPHAPCRPLPGRPGQRGRPDLARMVQRCHLGLCQWPARQQAGGRGRVGRGGGCGGAWGARGGRVGGCTGCLKQERGAGGHGAHREAPACSCTRGTHCAPASRTRVALLCAAACRAPGPARTCATALAASLRAAVAGGLRLRSATRATARTGRGGATRSTRALFRTGRGGATAVRGMLQALKRRRHKHPPLARRARRVRVRARSEQRARGRPGPPARCSRACRAQACIVGRPSCSCSRPRGSGIIGSVRLGGWGVRGLVSTCGPCAACRAGRARRSGAALHGQAVFRKASR